MVLNNLSLFDIHTQLGIVNYWLRYYISYLNLFNKTCQLLQDCGNLITRYRFGNDEFDCSRGSCTGWRSVNTMIGKCCTFNFHPSEGTIRSGYHSNQIGQRQALSILFNGHGPSVSGVFLRVHYPNKEISASVEQTALFPGFENFLRVFPNYRGSNKRFESLSLESRQCLLPRERKKAIDRTSICLDGCQTKNIHSICRCHPFFKSVVSSSIRNCTISDLHCFIQNFCKKLLQKYYLDFGVHILNRNFFLIRISKLKKNLKKTFTSFLALQMNSMKNVHHIVYQRVISILTKLETHKVN